MTTREELEKAIKESNDLLRWLTNIVKAIQEDEMSLLDVEAHRESYDNRVDELKEKLEEIIKLRMWLGFEEMEGQF